MGRGYSMDLRERVVATYKSGGRSMQEVADLFDIGVATVNRWLRWDRERGSPAPLPHGGGVPLKIGPAEWALVEAELRARPDVTMLELTWFLEEQTGLVVSRSTMQRTVRLKGWTRKKSASGPKSAIWTESRSFERASKTGNGA